MLEFLRRFFCRLFDCDKGRGRILLSPVTPEDYTGEAGETLSGGVGVVARDVETGRPVTGARLRFVVVKGPAALSGGFQELLLTTNPEGIATADLTLREKGYSLVGVELEHDETTSVYFDGHTNEMTHELSLHHPTCIPAAQGEVQVLISALDPLERPVEGADLVIELHNETLDLPMTGRVEPIRPGLYRGTIETHAAGAFTLVAQDKATLTRCESPICILPDAPVDFELLAGADPRAAAPYDELEFDVALVDRYGNAHPPDGIRAVLKESGTELIPTLFLRTARFTLSAAGYMHLPLLLKHDSSGLEKEVTVPFAAVWLSDPGLIWVGDAYKTSLYAVPRPGQAADHATIEIEFNPELAAFKAFVKSEGGPEFQSEVAVQDKSIVLSLKSEHSFTAEKYPAGVYIGDLSWVCLGDGETCFSLTGKMSPSSPPWELCVEQKKKLNSCICVNVIYPKGDTTLRDDAKKEVEKQMKDVVSSRKNVARCCPELSLSVKDCGIPKKEITRRVGKNGRVDTENEWTQLGLESWCQEQNCINLYLVPLKLPGSTPTSERRALTTIGPPGHCVIDPSTVGKVKNIVAHEICHALRLKHVRDRKNLMYEYYRSKKGYQGKLTKSQCRQIFQTLSSYPC